MTQRRVQRCLLLNVTLVPLKPVSPSSLFLLPPQTPPPPPPQPNYFSRKMSPRVRTPLTDPTVPNLKTAAAKENRGKRFVRISLPEELAWRHSMSHESTPPLLNPEQHTLPPDTLSKARFAVTRDPRGIAYLHPYPLTSTSLSPVPPRSRSANHALQSTERVSRELWRAKVLSWGLEGFQLGAKLDHARLHFIVLAPTFIRIRLELLIRLQVEDVGRRLFDCEAACRRDVMVLEPACDLTVTV